MAKIADQGRHQRRIRSPTSYSFPAVHDDWSMTSSRAPGLPVNEGEWIAQLKKAAETGQLVDLAPGEDLHPAEAATWGRARQIPAAALRQVLTSSDLNVDSRGLLIRGARFTEPLDLEYAVFPHPLHLIQCSLEANA